MKYKIIVRPDGVLEYECDNMADALEFARRASANGAHGPTRRRGPGRPRTSESVVANSKAEIAMSSTLEFLTALIAARTSGLTSEDVVRILGLAGTKGVGGALIKIRRIIRDLDMRENSVVRSIGSPGKGRWRAGPRIDEAIEKLQEQKGGQGE